MQNPQVIKNTQDKKNCHENKNSKLERKYKENGETTNKNLLIRLFPNWANGHSFIHIGVFVFVPNFNAL